MQVIKISLRRGCHFSEIDPQKFLGAGARTVPYRLAHAGTPTPMLWRPREVKHKPFADVLLPQWLRKCVYYFYVWCICVQIADRLPAPSLAM